jgi:SAM-dependent methyltransferase
MAAPTAIRRKVTKRARKLKKRGRKKLLKSARRTRRKLVRTLRLPPEGYRMYAIYGAATFHKRRWQLTLKRAPVMTVEEHAAQVGLREIEEVIGCHLCGNREIRSLFHRRAPKQGQKWNYWVVQCTNCGLLFRHPGVKPERLGDLYSKNYSRFLTGHYGEGRKRRYRMVMDVFDPLLADGTGRKILDYGCGTGLFLDVAEERGFEPYGVDLSEDSIEEARTRSSGAHAYFGQPYDVPEIAEGGFDVITLWSVLAHLARPIDDFKMLRSLLKDDGLLPILTVNANSLQMKAHRKDWGGFTKNHLAIYQPATLKLLLRQSGFGAVVIRPWYGEAFERGRIPLWPRQERRVRRNVEDGYQGNMMRAVAFADPDGPRRWGVHDAVIL